MHVHMCILTPAFTMHAHPNTRLHPCCIATPLGKRLATRHPVLSKRLQRTQRRHNTPAEQHSHTPTVWLLRTDAPQSTSRTGSAAKHVHRCHPTIAKHQHSRAAGTRSHTTQRGHRKGKQRASIEHAIRDPEGHGDTTARGRLGKPTAVAVPHISQPYTAWRCAHAWAS